MASERKAPEFSKLIMIFAMAINAVVIIFAMVMIAVTLDLAPLAYLIPAVAAELAAGSAFYYAKAKVENRIKLMKQYGVEPSRDSFRDSGDNESEYYGGFG